MNPVDAWIYPISSLGEFRKWLHESYLPEKYPKYLERKIKKGDLPSPNAKAAIEALVPKNLPS